MHDHVGVGQGVAYGGLDGIRRALALDDGLTGWDADDRVGEVVPAGLTQPQAPQLDVVAESTDRLVRAGWSASAGRPLRRMANTVSTAATTSPEDSMPAEIRPRLPVRIPVPSLRTTSNVAAATETRAVLAWPLAAAPGMGWDGAIVSERGRTRARSATTAR
jgi:hypothetical protein